MVNKLPPELQGYCVHIDSVVEAIGPTGQSRIYVEVCPTKKNFYFIGVATSADVNLPVLLTFSQARALATELNTLADRLEKARHGS